MKAKTIRGGIFASLLILFSSTFLAFGQSCDPAPSGIVSWWPGEGNADDIIGANNGIASSGLGYTTGEVGEAFAMNGTNANFYAPASASLDVGAHGTGVTIEAWIAPSNVNGLQPIVEWNSSPEYPPHDGRIGVQLWIGQNPSSQGVLCATFMDTNVQNGEYIQVTSPPGALVPNVWQHVAVTYDLGSGTITLYINGEVVASQFWGHIVPDTSYNFWVGHRPGDEPGDWTYGTFLSGPLDELSLYNRALTTNEIAAIYQAGPDGKCSPSTVSSGIPIITSFSPALGAAGTVVNINGSNFSPTAANNIVYFGAVRATVQSASATSLTVMVPAGATYAPITETINGLTAYANTPFVPTFPASVPANFSLGPQLVLPAGDGPSGVVIADLDGDGKPDVVVNNGNDHTIDVYRNISADGTLGTNSFAPAVVLPIGMGGQGGMVAADLTGDGKLDLICVDASSDVVTVLKNLCTPGNITSNSFAPYVNFVVGNGPRGVAVQDLNGDGKPEIVSANWQDNSVSVLRNTSTPGIIDSNSFAPGVVFATGTTPQNVMIADMDGDGKPDVVTVDNNYNGGAPGMSVLRNISTGTNFDFENHVDFPGAVDTYCLAIGDLDGDGKPDVVVGAQGGNPGGANSMLIYRNTSTPGSITAASFAPPVIIPAGGWVNWVSLADLNGDGKLDIAAAMQLPSQLAVYINTSTPGSISNNSFASPQIFPSGYNANGLAIGDLNGDGIPDIAFANTYDGTFSFYQNLTASSGGGGIPPYITIQPANEAVILGGTATFSVTAGGSAPLSYQWYFDGFDGTNLVGTNATLTLHDVSAPDVGTYRVSIANAYGATNSAAAKLSVGLPPFIVSPPTNETVTAGGTAVFSVTATGSSPLSYQWYFMGTTLVGTNATLVLDDVTPTDAGLYQVVVANAYASASATATLTVNPISTTNSNIPVITSFSPALGAAETVVNIYGSNFSPTPLDNIIYFGAVRATVESASKSNLTVKVPAGATYAPITETVNGLTAYASKPFVPTFSASAPAKFSLGPQLVLPAGNGPSGVVIADLDGDGKPDVVVDNGNDHTVDIYRNISADGTLGTSSFAPPVVLSIGNGGEGGMVAADLTGDGKLDLIFVDSSSDVITVLKNLCTLGNITSNSFASPVNFVVGQGPRGVAVQDLNGDGKPEIVSANWQDNSVSVLRNTSTPGIIDSNSFAPGVVFPTGPTPQNVMIADMDGDGKPDVVTVDNNYNGGGPGMSVLRNISTGTTFDFENHVDFPGAVDTYCLAIGDLDGDGKPDVVVGAQGGNSGGANSMLIYRNTSTPGNISPASFAAPVIIPAGGWVNWVSLADLNGDGKLDIAAAMQLPSQLAIYINTSTPGSISNNAFASPQIFASGYNANGLAIGDLNGDGIPDIAFANTYDGTFSFYQNLTAASGGGGIPPYIIIQPHSETVAVGGTATFSVTAGGSAPLSYQWYFDNTSIPGATNSMLILTNVPYTDDDGSVYVTVANRYGSTNSVTATLTLYSTFPPEGPEIITQPGNQTVAEGETATFRVNAVGGAPLRYQWHFDGVGITGATNPVLTLNDVQPGEAGGYYVTVANFFGSTNSTTAMLTVSSSSSSCDPVPSGIVAWWPANGNTDDIIGTNNGVVTNGMVGYAPAEVGLGFNFDGGPNRLIVPDSPSLDIGPNADFTIESWIRAFPTNTPQGVMSIADKRYLPTSFQCQGYEVSLLYGQLNLRISDDPSGNGENWSAGPNLLDGQLHHIAVTVTRDSTNGGNLYVDGTSVLQFDPTAVEGDLTSTQPLRIGNHPDPTYTSFFDGQIDELSLYKRALSSSEIAGIYQAGSAGKCLPSHQAGDHFDWSQITSPKFRDMPFAVTITARNAADAVVTNYMGRVFIGSSNGIPVFPPASGDFIHGAWTGKIVILDAATNVELIARDISGQNGISNPFNVLNRPRLTTIRDHGKWKFMWPVFESGFELEMTTNLSSGKWVPVPGHYLRDGDQYVLPVTPASTNSQVFYRLHFIGQSTPDKDPLRH